MIFTNVIKPTHICNLSCTYCYNEDERAPIMSEATLERTVLETIRFARTQGDMRAVDFIWHGGEPLVAGIDFYRKAIACAVDQDLRIDHTVQTNGILIDDTWATFFKQHGVRVSVSIDGPAAINDKTRQYRNGKGSFRNITRGIACLRRHEIPFGVCVVISKANVHLVDDIYEFLVDQKLPFNVIPLTRSGAGLSNFDDVGITPNEYADAWIRMFDRWYAEDEASYVFSSDFVHKSRAVLSGKPTDCIGQSVCSRYHVSTDPCGDVYPCSTLSGDPQWKYGSICDQSLDQLFCSPAALLSLARKVDPHCHSCKWQHVCYGGCMARSVKYFGTNDTRDYYCEGLYRIYDHVSEVLRKESTIDLSQLPNPELRDNREPPAARVLAFGDLVRIPVSEIRRAREKAAGTI